MFDCSIRWYPSLLPTMRQIVREQQPDLLVADHASAPAIDAAYEAGVPFVVLSGVLGNVLPSERTAPHFATSFPAAMSWRQRVVNRALPFWLRMQSRGRQARFAQVRAECGITAPFGEQFRDNLTIVTTCFGLELPRAASSRAYHRSNLPSATSTAGHRLESEARRRCRAWSYLRLVWNARVTRQSLGAGLRPRRIIDRRSPSIWETYGQ